MLDPLDTQEVESLEEEEEDPLGGLLEGILPNTGPMADSDDFAQELMPNEIADEPVRPVPGAQKPLVGSSAVVHTGIFFGHASPNPHSGGQGNLPRLKS